ncbi:hypothetical protein ACFQS1_09605 [Paractinoplanes rhizophilus]|uniref:4-amino-4-deoxy-L-arabinose transferase-like glycosyltransferase n=1 Tax=Paractinoplanes rhizophilus TaxID=1416877 RepID=A0ABW2HN16_9ACTN
MIEVLNAPEVRSAPVSPHRNRIPAGLPWLVPAAVLVVALLATGTPAWDVLRYAAYLALAVLLPGTLVHRALRGTRGNLPEDLGFGGATGLLLMLAGWALAAATGLQILLPAWPVLIVVPFVVAPRLRRHWRIAEPRPLPSGWHWALAIAVALVAVWAVPSWRASPLPPADAFWYQDLGYHLALVHELMRSMPFQVPQLAGDILHYHYLSDADMATASMITRIDPATLLLRLWLPAIAALTALVTAALARQLAGKWWAGALGGALAVAGFPLVLGAPSVAAGASALSYLSPSAIYQLPLVALLLSIAVDVLRGRPVGWAWVLVFPLALACAGAKSSSLPPIVAGLVAAALAIVLWHRARLRSTLTLLGLVLAAMLTGLKLFSGGGAGVLTFQPLTYLYLVAPYRQTLGVHDLNDGVVPPGIAHASVGGLLFVAALLVWWALMQAGRLAGLTMIVRRDPSAWMLAGITVAGAGGMWLLWHPSASQGYFYTGVLPFASVLTVWLLAERSRGRRPVFAGLAAGFVWALIAAQIGLWLFAAPAPTMTSWLWALLRPVLLTAPVAALAAVLLRRRRQAIPIALLAAVLGASVGGFAFAAGHGATVSLRDTAVPSPSFIITKDEMAAAKWLDRRAGEDDVIATNVHCRLLPTRAKMCDARAFWVVALTGRRALVESWGYTDQAVAADNVRGLKYVYQPAPYPARFALNERVFAKGDPADVAELRTRYHVRWLFADSRYGKVSPELAGSARVRHTAGPVTIYELG